MLESHERRRRTGAVVEALLFLGRDDSLNATVVVDLQTVVNETVEVYRPLARAKGLELQVECSGEQLITAPPGTASIVLQNLVENAIRFTDHGASACSWSPAEWPLRTRGSDFLEWTAAGSLNVATAVMRAPAPGLVST